MHNEVEEINFSLPEVWEELKTTEENLRQQNLYLEAERLKYQDLFDFAPDGYLVTNPSGVIQAANKSIARLLGIATDFLVGKPLIVFIAQPDYQFFYTQIDRPWCHNQPQSWEIRLQPRQGKVFPAEVTVAPIFDNSDTVTGLRWLIRDITVRRQAQTLLQASEQRYISLAETVPVGIFRTDAEGNATYLNNRWCEIAGLDPESAIGSGWLAALHPEDRDRVVTKWYKSAQENSPFQLEYRFQRPDGQVTWVYGQAEAERDANGQIIGYAGTLTDISDRKQAEQQLQNLIEGTAATTGKDYFPALVRYIAEALDVSDVAISEKVGEELHILALWANDSLQPTFTFPIDLTPCAESLKYGRFYCESSVQEQFPTDLELVEMGAESYLGIALKDTQGKEIGNLCILDRQPIHYPQRAENLLRVFAARAAAELERERVAQALAQLNQELEQRILERTAALEASESELRSLFMGMDDLVFVLDRTGKYLKVAPTNPEKLAASADNLVGKNIQDIFSAEQAAQFLWTVEQTLATQQTQDYEYSLTINATEYWFNAKCSPLNDRSVVWVARDVSGAKRDEVVRKEYEQRLELSNQQLLRATRLKDEFLANMSHELRTPLNAILGMSELLQEELVGTLNEDQKNSISTIESSGEHLLSVINDILDVAKIESGKLELERSTVSIADLCHSSLTFVQQQAYKKQLQLVIQLAPNLGNIQIDERRMRQVLINLLNNAVKFTPDRGCVTLEVQKKNEECHFLIVDTGIGIASEDRPKLFKPFMQIDSKLNRQYDGSGLGLVLVKQIVELHGGSVTVTSELDIGSCFTVIVPYHTQPNIF